MLKVLNKANPTYAEPAQKVKLHSLPVLTKRKLRSV